MFRRCTDLSPDTFALIIEGTSITSFSDIDKLGSKSIKQKFSRYINT